MAKTKTTELSREDIRRLCGDILDWKVDAIIATGAGFEELEEAVAWASGQDDEMAEERKSLTGVVAEVYDLLTADDEFSEEDRPRHSRETDTVVEQRPDEVRPLRWSPGFTSMAPRRA